MDGDDGLNNEHGINLEDDVLEADGDERREMERRRNELTEEAMKEIREEWIDERPRALASPRELRRWRNHLAFMDDEMKRHAKQRSPECVMREVYLYATRGHKRYKNMLDDLVADKDITEAERQEADRMLKNYDGERNLNKYLNKGLKRLENDQLEWMSDTTSVASSAVTSISNVSQRTRRIVEDQRRRHENEMEQLKEQMKRDQRMFREEMENMLRKETAAHQMEMQFVLTEKKKELERGRESTKSLLKENQLVLQNLAAAENRVMEAKIQNSEYHNQMKKAEVIIQQGEQGLEEARRAADQERRLRLQQERMKNDMEKELGKAKLKYKELEDRKLFPDAEIFNQEQRRREGGLEYEGGPSDASKQEEGRRGAQLKMEREEEEGLQQEAGNRRSKLVKTKVKDRSEELPSTSRRIEEDFLEWEDMFAYSRKVPPCEPIRRRSRL